MGADRAGRVRTALAVLGCLGLATAFGACGNGGGGGGPSTVADGGGVAAAPASRCVGSFNASAPETLPRLARLAHKRGNDLLVGTYDGRPFSARVYDQDLTAGDRSRATVSTGACVVTEVTGGLGTLYVFAVGGDGEWHNFSVADPAVLVADDPESKLAGSERASLSAAVPPALPRLVLPSG